MNRRAVLLLLLLCLFVGAGRDRVLLGQNAQPTLILISFDGFRWDYRTLYSPTNINRLAAKGVSADLIPSYPSKTFPNHYTIVTGLYPGHHGIVANTIKDPATGRRLSMTNSIENQDPMWWGGEPIWVTAHRAGILSASMFWVGSEAPIEGHRPNFWSPFNDSLSGSARVDHVLGWLDLPTEKRPRLLTLYINDVDGAGHSSGPESSAVRTAVRRVDGYLGRLLRGLERRHLSDAVNIVIVSDHGMAETSTDRVVVLDDYISPDDVEIIEINPTLGLFPKPGRNEAVYKALVNAHPRLKIYRKAETPEHWHYRDHPRIPPIVGVVDEGWQVLPRATLNQRLSRGQTDPRGEHGYDPRDAISMRGIFVAAGPAFKSGVVLPAFENVHIYGALAGVLGLTPAKNDGDPARARAMLK
jgi:predicted AlkP superfamily pyrophosphatase or phosphodiesterase